MSEGSRGSNVGKLLGVASEAVGKAAMQSQKLITEEQIAVLKQVVEQGHRVQGFFDFSVDDDQSAASADAKSQEGSEQGSGEGSGQEPESDTKSEASSRSASWNDIELVCKELELDPEMIGAGLPMREDLEIMKAWEAQVFMKLLTEKRCASSERVTLQDGLEAMTADLTAKMTAGSG